MLPKIIYQNAPKYCHSFFNLIETDDLLVEFRKAQVLTNEVLNVIPEEAGDYAYAENKWTIKDVMQHLIDCEKIFQYRALRFSRFDSTPLAGFNENDYATAYDTKLVTLHKIKEEYNLVREVSKLQFEPLSQVQLFFKAQANATDYSPIGLAFMIIGHNIHHINVLKERYL